MMRCGFWLAVALGVCSCTGSGGPEALSDSGDSTGADGKAELRLDLAGDARELADERGGDRIDQVRPEDLEGPEEHADLEDTAEIEQPDSPLDGWLPHEAGTDLDDAEQEAGDVPAELSDLSEVESWPDAPDLADAEWWPDAVETSDLHDGLDSWGPDAADPGEEAGGETVQPGTAGLPCTQDEECPGGECIDTAWGLLCTGPCDDECPNGWGCFCAVLEPACEPSLCGPAWWNLCRPCMASDECSLSGVDTGDRCVPFGPSGAFCGGYCPDGSCPQGYLCQEVQDIEGTSSPQCMPEGGECHCPPWIAAEAPSTACAVENQWGICAGERHCDAQGLTECSAPMPAAETCNLSDDDCDGVVDEGTGGGSCLVKNDFGQCPGALECTNGSLLCSGPEAQLEVCDGQDDDCDGIADDGYPDTDADGAADCVEKRRTPPTAHPRIRSASPVQKSSATARTMTATGSWTKAIRIPTETSGPIAWTTMTTETGWPTPQTAPRSTPRSRPRPSKHATARTTTATVSPTSSSTTSTETAG
ncbi:MAG: hypothetical protein FJ109_21620, partial [Deltaproteobacteria bacterium]|nr:hypothetical protein [Deltaproteobacteria bacterium]